MTHSGAHPASTEEHTWFTCRSAPGEQMGTWGTPGAHMNLTLGAHLGFTPSCPLGSHLGSLGSTWFNILVHTWAKRGSHVGKP